MVYSLDEFRFNYLADSGSLNQIAIRKRGAQTYATVSGFYILLHFGVYIRESTKQKLHSRSHIHIVDFRFQAADWLPLESTESLSIVIRGSANISSRSLLPTHRSPCTFNYNH